MLQLENYCVTNICESDCTLFAICVGMGGCVRGEQVSTNH